MTDHYKGKSAFASESVNDDLESFFKSLQNGENVKEEAYTFLLPKLTDKELKQVEDKDPEHFMSYLSFNDGDDPDVTKEQMEKSKSRSKFVRGFCMRTTEFLEINSS